MEDEEEEEDEIDKIQPITRRKDQTGNITQSKHCQLVSRKKHKNLNFLNRKRKWI